MPPLDGAVGAAASLLSLLSPAVGGSAAAIVALTITVRLLLSPLSYAQVRGERRRAALAPRVAALQRRYAKDPARLRAELFDLYRTEGASPFAGCLPALAQAPFFFVLYRLFTAPPAGTDLLADRLFGVPLSAHLGSGGPAIAVFAVLLAALTALAWLSARRIRHSSTVEGPAARVLPLLPYLTVGFAALVPLAAGLYLVTTTAWTALEHAVLRRPGPAAASP